MPMIENLPPFYEQRDGYYYGTDTSRGPWDADACHGGPVAAILTHCAESLLPEKQLVRATFDYLRPVTMHGFQVRGEVVKNGRLASNTVCEIVEKSGKVAARANTLHIEECAPQKVPANHLPPPEFEKATRVTGLVAERGHDLPNCATFFDLAYPPGESPAPGPCTYWMRTTRLFADEELSPFQRVCTISDSASGFSRNEEMTDISFLNADLTISLFRQPTSNWIAAEAKSFWQQNGFGMAETRLFDRTGSIGAVSQNLVVREK